MSHITVITYADYESDKKSMTTNDLAFCNAMAYTSDLNDTEQFIASLKGILVDSSSDNDLPLNSGGKNVISSHYDVKGPIGVDDDLARLASERSVTGMAHNLSYK
jgi:hypothetical protein